MPITTVFLSVAATATTDKRCARAGRKDLYSRERQNNKGNSENSGVNNCYLKYSQSAIVEDLWIVGHCHDPVTYSDQLPDQLLSQFTRRDFRPGRVEKASTSRRMVAG